jgi:hypothetical protein
MAKNFRYLLQEIIDVFFLQRSLSGIRNGSLLKPPTWHPVACHDVSPPLRTAVVGDEGIANNSFCPSREIGSGLKAVPVLYDLVADLLKQVPCPVKVVGHPKGKRLKLGTVRLVKGSDLLDGHDQ